MNIAKCISCKRTRVDEIDGSSVCSLGGELIYDCVDGNKWLDNTERQATDTNMSIDVARRRFAENVKVMQKLSVANRTDDMPIGEINEIIDEIRNKSTVK